MSDLERIVDNIFEAIREGSAHHYPEYIVRADIIEILEGFESRIRAKIEYRPEVEKEWN